MHALVGILLWNKQIKPKKPAKLNIKKQNYYFYYCDDYYYDCYYYNYEYNYYCIVLHAI